MTDELMRQDRLSGPALMTTVLVTGANGFVGRAVCSALEQAGCAVRRAVRSAPGKHGGGVVVGDIGPGTCWAGVLQGVTAVVHLAARVHVAQDAGPDALGAFRAVNAAGTENLARQAAAAGVRRLVYLSSVKVNGESTDGRHPYTEFDTPHPVGAYAISKFEAEQALHRVAAETGLEVVILRPPLVYGPGVKANFLRLIEWVARGIPFPLGTADNRRSMVYLGNLVDAIVLCLRHPGAAGKTFLVSDGEDLSTPQLIRLLAQELGCPAHLIPCPPALLRAAAFLVGRRGEAERLLGSLAIDSSRIRRELGWSPPCSVAQGLKETVEWYRTAVVGKI